jgi:hypothetical protein
MTTSLPWKRKEADAGYRLCPDCKGSGHCWLCEGRGWHAQPDGSTKECSNCLGRGTCIVCDGEGQVWIKPYERAQADQAPTKKRPVHLVARLREFGYEDGPSVLTLKEQLGTQDSDAIARYLERGKLLMMSPGLVEDPFAPGKHAGSYSILTDGEFAWHEALAYFVRHYHVSLPSELVEHARANAFEVPRDVNTRLLTPVES